MGVVTGDTGAAGADAAGAPEVAGAEDAPLLALAAADPALAAVGGSELPTVTVVTVPWMACFCLGLWVPRA